MFRRELLWLPVVSLLVFSGACSDGESSERKAEGTDTSGTTADGTGATSGTGTSGTLTGLDTGTGATGTDTETGGAGASDTGTGASDTGTGAIGTGSTDTQTDTGLGGSGGSATVDVGLGGIGGTEDVGVGGTDDVGVGGTDDVGTGGTIDTCIPTCVPNVLGEGEKAVNMVVFENADSSGCDTEGRLWVGGNATFSGYGVGAQLLECDPVDPVLVVGGDLSHTSGAIKGSIWVGGEYTGQDPQCGSVIYGDVGDADAPVDFAELQRLFLAYSKLLSEYPTNGTVTNEYGKLVFTPGAPSTEFVHVFEITAEQFSNMNGADFTAFGAAGYESATVIINVSGTSASLMGGSPQLPDGICGSGAVDLDDFCNQIVWNMPEMETLVFEGYGAQGTVLAPHASLSGTGQINGTVIIREFAQGSGACVEMHPHYFNGCLCVMDDEDSPYACCP